MKPGLKVGRKEDISTSKKIKKSSRSEHARHPIFHDEFNCHCSICRNFYQTLINGGRNHIYMNPPLCLPKEKTLKPFVHNWIKLGDRVVVKEKFSGVVKYVGPLDNDLLLPEVHVGVHLDEAIGMHAGIVSGKRYFETPKGRGIMVKYHEVRKIKPPDKRPPLTGNEMFPSYNPKHYRNFLARSDTNLSDRSTKSSRSIHKRAQTAPPIGRKSSSKKISPKVGIQTQKGSGLMDMDKRVRGQLPSEAMRHVNRWRQEYGQEQADTMAAMLRKMYISRGKGKKEKKVKRVIPLQAKSNTHHTERQYRKRVTLIEL